MKKCLILGGSGFIGSAVCNQLLTEGWSLKILNRLGAPLHQVLQTSNSIEWIKGDFRNSVVIKDALLGVDAVIHVISTSLPQESNENPISDVQENVIGTLSLLNEMVKSRVKKIVFASSGGTVYGRPQSLPITEKHPTEPEVSYGITKLSIEKYLYLYSRLHGLKPIILRLANPYGAHQRINRSQGVVAAFLHRALNKLPLEVWGDGTVTRDYLHVEDVATAFALALNYTGTEMIFNISSGIGTSLNDLIKTIELLVGHPIERNYFLGRSFDIPVSVLANELAVNELGWCPSISLVDGLKRIIDDALI
jgi:UDP-glucose 4-epimerase